MTAVFVFVCPYGKHSVYTCIYNLEHNHTVGWLYNFNTTYINSNKKLETKNPSSITTVIPWLKKYKDRVQSWLPWQRVNGDLRHFDSFSIISWRFLLVIDLRVLPRSAASLKYSAANDLNTDTPPCHIILTPGQPVVVLFS